MNVDNVSVLISEEKIHQRIEELGQQISEQFADKNLLVIGVLKGSFMFYSDLIRAISCDIECDFLGVSSYKGARSSGEIKVTLDLAQNIKGRHVMIIEDIVDTGLTLNYLKKTLQARNPETITTTSLLFKPKALLEPCEVDHIGFEIGNDFVVGYGLDYQENYRNLPYVGVLSNLN